MDPAKRASVGTRVEEQVKDWLRYGEELGLGPFYRDRAPLQQASEPPYTEPTESAPAAMAAALGTARRSPDAALSAAAAPKSSASVKPVAAPAPAAVVAPASVPSL
ncbi:MAG: hypothetical protein WCA00_18455, partial [Candidatus Acidiferrales bacterium]